MAQKGSLYLLLIIVIVVILVVGLGVYLLRKPKGEQNLNNKPSPTGSPATHNIPAENIKTITVQDNYQFTVKIPAGYSFKEGLGDYSGYITNSVGETIIGFQRSTGGGERGPIKDEDKIIDNVPFEVYLC